MHTTRAATTRRAIATTTTRSRATYRPPPPRAAGARQPPATTAKKQQAARGGAPLKQQASKSSQSKRINGGGSSAFKPGLCGRFCRSLFTILNSRSCFSRLLARSSWAVQRAPRTERATESRLTVSNFCFAYKIIRTSDHHVHA